ncbi:hypothetical protein F2Q70_00010584 [Brassica cretica]|uniref:Uncharacterized protein n=1 Tax=Brassica cretica TaxID=69181 RepID=A0A8S9MA36_BRACR|nr:hypothetical protein F2Q70_00010584 [Brassica cretica]
MERDEMEIEQGCEKRSSNVGSMEKKPQDAAFRRSFRRQPNEHDFFKKLPQTQGCSYLSRLLYDFNPSLEQAFHFKLSHPKKFLLSSDLHHSLTPWDRNEIDSAVRKTPNRAAIDFKINRDSSEKEIDGEDGEIVLSRRKRHQNDFGREADEGERD